MSCGLFCILGWHRQRLEVSILGVPEWGRGLPLALLHPPGLCRKAAILHGDWHGPVRQDQPTAPLAMRPYYAGGTLPICL